MLERLAAGELAPPDQYYFRTGIRLSTVAPALDHLNRIITVGVGERRIDSVHITVYRVP